MKQTKIQPWQYESELVVLQPSFSNHIPNPSGSNLQLQLSRKLEATKTEQKNKPTLLHRRQSTCSVDSKKKNIIQKNVASSSSSIYKREQLNICWSNDNMKQFIPLNQINFPCYNPQIRKNSVKTTYIGYLDDQPALFSSKSRNLTMKQLLEKHRIVKKKQQIQKSLQSAKEIVRQFTTCPPQNNSINHHFKKMLKAKDKLRPKSRANSFRYQPIETKQPSKNCQEGSTQLFDSFQRPTSQNQKIVSVLDQWKNSVLNKQLSKNIPKSKPIRFGVIGYKINY